MGWLLPLVSLVAGIVLLVLGAEALVRGASSLAKEMSISEIAIGLTVVALGTSAPELVVNTFAAARGHSSIVFGNIIGSNMANTLLILGIAALIYPLSVQRNTVWREIPFLLVATLVVFFLVHDCWRGAGAADWLSRKDGLVLLGLFAIFVIYTFGLFRVESSDQYEVRTYRLWVSVVMMGAGMGALLFGGRFAVNGAVEIARGLGISQKLIASTVIAGGTSLPELATSAVAAYRKRCDIAVGNIVGSNIFNLLMVLGISSVVRPVSHPSSSFNVDWYMLILATMILFVAMFTGKRRKLDRWEALLMLVCYAWYIGYLVYVR
ncbi:MAG: calcium/sodium antiporter [Candidatus Brocadiae bacterium]|nr:calcium/sodium antiporter [Candidatus Brocadiia bacterium]